MDLETALFTQIRNCQLKYRGKRYPEEVRDVNEGDPFYIWINDDERPDECSEDKEDVDRGEIIIF